MASLPSVSGRTVVGAFGKLGWEVARQRGSHIILVKEGAMATLSVPNHREVAKEHAPQPDPLGRNYRG